MTASPTKGAIKFIPLVCMTTALFLTLRNMPAMAQTGTQMLVFNLIAVCAFLIPAALVSAELGTGWPESGVFGWVEAAFGTRAALVASWLQWAQSVFGLTSILAYAAGTAAYVFSPELGANRVFVCLSIIFIYWVATFMNFFGAKNSSMISTVCLTVGVVTPSVILIISGLVWLLTGHHDSLNVAAPIFPQASDTGTLVLFLSFIFGFVGIEVSASLIKDVDNPKKTYPKALFIAAGVGFVVTLAGAGAISAIVPEQSIDTINGAIQALSAAFHAFHLSALVPVFAALIAMGAVGQVSTWIVGPVRGLAVAGSKGFLPPKMLKKNKAGVPTKMLIAQASCVSVIGLVFLVIPSVSTTFLILTSVAVVLYSVMYILMFASALRLRHTHPKTPRAYTVPGKWPGIIIIAGVGLCTVSSCFVIGFIAPDPNPLHSSLLYGIVLAVVCAAVTSVAFIAKKRWRPVSSRQLS